VEALGVGCIGLGIALLISSTDAALGARGPHVAWIAVILMAARYGTEGLLLALPLVWGPLLAAAAFLHAFGALTARFERADDLAGLAAAVLVGWVASTHERRHGDLTTKLEVSRQRSAAQQSLLDEFEEAFLGLCGRADRLELSLSFLRDVAARIEGDDPEAAAEATLDLALARLGARAGLVQRMNDDVGTSPLAATGAWSSAGGGAADLSGDHAVIAAIRTCMPVRAGDLADASPSDADLVVPLLDATSLLIGVLAVRGVPHGGTSPAALQDLTVMGGWLAAALCRADRMQVATDGRRIDDGFDSERISSVPEYFEITVLGSGFTPALAGCQDGASS
jgi:hypothetical protein